MSIPSMKVDLEKLEREDMEERREGRKYGLLGVALFLVTSIIVLLAHQYR